MLYKRHRVIQKRKHLAIKLGTSPLCAVSRPKREVIHCDGLIVCDGVRTSFKEKKYDIKEKLLAE